MLPPLSASVLLIALPIVASYEVDSRCPKPYEISCSDSIVKPASDANSGSLPSTCCVPSPAGLFSYSRHWDQDKGEWTSGLLKILKSVRGRMISQPLYFDIRPVATVQVTNVCPVQVLATTHRPLSPRRTVGISQPHRRVQVLPNGSSCS